MISRELLAMLLMATILSSAVSAVTTYFTNKTAIELLRHGEPSRCSSLSEACGAGRLYCGLERNGNAEPCVSIPIEVSNIREQPLVDIWRHSPILKKMRDRDALTSHRGLLPSDIHFHLSQTSEASPATCICEVRSTEDPYRNFLPGVGVDRSVQQASNP